MAEAERTISTPDDASTHPSPQSVPGPQSRAPESPAEGEEQREAAAGPEAESVREAGREPDGESEPVQESRESGDDRAKRAALRRRRVLVLFSVAALAYVLDLVSKLLVVERLEHHEPVDILGDWLRLEAVRNPGAAFGMGEAFTVIFTLIAAVVIVVIVRLARKLYSLPWAIALGMLLGGALGNLTDRLFRSPGVFKGEVVDFIAPKGFAVFNLADSAIVCGGILIVLLSFLGRDPDGTVHKD